MILTLDERGRRGVLLLALALTASRLSAEPNFSLRGEVGLRYFGRNPFLSRSSAWRYVQGVADLGLAGYVWDPRFLQFELGGSFHYTGFGGITKSPDNDFLGYRLEARLFPKSKLSFGLRYLRNDMGTARKAAPVSALRYAQEERGFDVSVARLGFFPSIRLSYTDKEYRSSVSETKTNERENRLDLDVNQAAGFSSFDLGYRREAYDNQSFDWDRKYEYLRATERLQVGAGTSLWFEGILTRNTLDLSGGRSFDSSYRQLSANALSRISRRLHGSVRYAYVQNSVDGTAYALQTGQAFFHYSIFAHFTVSPFFIRSRNEIDGRAGADTINDSQAGARLTWDGSWKILSWRTEIELAYHRRDSLAQGRAGGWSEALGANLTLGSPRSLLGSLSYSYSATDADTGVPDSANPLFYYGLGTNLDRHSARLDLRSSALRPLDIYLYARYDTYDRVLFDRKPMKATTSNYGLRTGLGRLSVAADIGDDEAAAGSSPALYRTLTSTLDYAASGSVDLRVQFIQRKRRGVENAAEDHRNLSVFLNFNLARFRASLIYQQIAWQLDGPPKRDEMISATMTRSFGTRR